MDHCATLLNLMILCGIISVSGKAQQCGGLEWATVEWENQSSICQACGGWW